MNNQRAKLGILDWGVGGIGVLKALRERGATFPVVYFSDAGAAPYGRMSRAELISRLNRVIEFLKTKNVTHLVIGCNAASTVIALLDAGGMKIEGMIETAVELAAKSKPERLAVIGGKRTISSGVYRRKFAEKGIKIRQRIAQNLSALIESGDVGSEILRSEARRILKPVKNSSHILLACTHYPAISGVLRDSVAPEAKLIDPAGALAEKIEKWNLCANGGDIFFTSGDAREMKRAAQNAFGFSLEKAEKIII